MPRGARPELSPAGWSGTLEFAYVRDEGETVRRAALLIACVVLIPLSGVLADSPGGPSAAPVVLTVTPATAPASATRDLVAHGVPPARSIPVIVFAPDGTQTELVGHSDEGGNLDVALSPADGFTQVGVYRAVLDLGNGPTQSVLFDIGDGTPLLTTEPIVFSPYSALQILGAGLPPNQSYDLVLTPANDRGDRTFRVSVDAGGFLQAYIWPQDLGESFYEAGLYRATLPALDLITDFQVREQPIGAVMSVDGPVLSGGDTPILFRRYESSRYLWTIYADSAREVRGEMLFGLTDAQGSLDAVATFTDLPGGLYRMATPYDWGETTFTAVPPTATPTDTPTATPTPTATATATSTPVPPVYKKVCKRKHGKRKCKRVRVSPP